MKFELSFDDYSPLNYKLAGLLLTYKLEKYTTFYIELKEEWEAKKQIRRFNELGFNIGSHTISHKHLTRLSPEEIERELKESKKIIEKEIGKIITKIAYPRDYTNETIDKMAKEIGYEKIRHRKDITCHIYPHSEYQMDWDEYARRLLREEKYLHLNGHSWEIEKYNYWDKLEKFLGELNENLYSSKNK